MRGYPWIPQIGLKPKEYPGPWGNSPEFFCDLCNRYDSVQELEEAFKEYMMDLIHHKKQENLLAVHNFFKLLKMSTSSSHINIDIDTLANNIEDLVYNFENDGISRILFIQKLKVHIIQEVSEEKSKWLRKIISSVESWETNMSPIISNIYWKKKWK